MESGCIKIKNDTLELRKSGKFYHAFGDNATILHYIMGYKIVAEKGGAGFPESAINKVINALEDNEISYIVYDKETIEYEKDFKKINAYKSILKKGVKALSNEERFQKIEKKITGMSAKELDNLLDLIEDAIS